MTFSRRGFLRGASGALGLFGAAVAMNKVLGSDAFAATLSGYGGYRALVSVFLLGGNDGNNLLVPLTSNGSTGPYDRYKAARPTVGLKYTAGALDNELLPINPAGLAAKSYGVHYKMPLLQGLFEAGKAAFVCNVGPLVLPMRKTDFDTDAVQKPDSLFSHSDQQDAWATAIANPSTVALPVDLQGVGLTGWGGRAADKIAPLHSVDYPELVMLGGRGLFGTGKTRSPLAMSSSGQFGLKVTGDPAFDELRDESLAEILTFTNSVTLEESYGALTGSAMVYADERTAARDAAWNALALATRNDINEAFGTATADGKPLAMTDGSIRAQLYQVIRDIIAGAAKTAKGGLGMRRQMFQVGLGGFDTHTNQRAVQDGLFAQLDAAIGSFQAAIEVLEDAAADVTAVFGGFAPQATLFTMSDFGRTLVENSDGGTDHAWGNHVVVVGSRVAGKKLYGAFPNLDMSVGAGNNDTTDSRGRWIPTLCVEQVANSLAYWLGATSATDRAYMFPNLAGFVTAATNGGFPAHTKAYRVSFMMADA